jgi:predicted lipoprotein with Yx(FWY)xxD motif
MQHTTSAGSVTRKAMALAAALAFLGLAACGSSSGTKAASTTATTAATANGSGAVTTTTEADSGDKPVTLSIADVPGVGSVLVNEDGRTLYLLSSEKGGKITCTDDNHCTDSWPDTELPKGDDAGKVTGAAKASLLGTIKSDDGDVYVTYGGWPLYTFVGDTGSGTAHGEGITSFGGTWYAISADGQPVMASTAGSGATTTTSGY